MKQSFGKVCSVTIKGRNFQLGRRKVEEEYFDEM